MLIRILNKNAAALTLVEVLIVVATVVLIVSIALPNYFRLHRHSQAERVLAELQKLDTAVRQYSMDTGKMAGMNPGYSDLRNYLKAEPGLYNACEDILGNSFGPFTIGSLPRVNPDTFNALSDVADAAFWSPFH
jgi:competence protein ComGC